MRDLTKLVVAPGIAKNGFTKETYVGFAKNTESFEVSFTEVSDAVASVPLCFRQMDGSFELHALFGTKEIGNAYVQPDNTWASRFVPFEMTIYPFCRHDASQDAAVLGIYSEGIVDHVEDNPNCFPILNDDGSLAQSAITVKDMLDARKVEIEKTRKIISYLNNEGVIKPWPVIFKHNGKEYKQENIFRIEERSLMDLGGKTLGLLGKQGCLGLAYSQILSEARLKNLTEFIRVTLEIDGLEGRLTTQNDENEETGSKFDF